MTFSPLMEAAFAIQLHACAALAAFALGVVQLAGVKGNLQHRALGYTWVALMVAVAVSSFWIQDMRVWGRWSPIHLLSILTLTMLPLGVLYARRHNVRGHKATMLGIFAGALVVAGIFTLVPGRIMHKVLFGG